MKFIIILSALPLYMLFNFIKGEYLHRKKMKKLDDWKQFNEKCVDWSKEIKDVYVRGEFLHHNIQRLLEISKNQEELISFDIEVETQKIKRQYGKHIPSFLPEIRDGKVNELLN